jgi:hypothetical protein
MKKSLIGLASLQVAAALASTATRTVNAIAASPSEVPQQPKLVENDDALSLKPIVTKEMKAGTQPMLKTGKTVKRRDLNPVSLATRKPVHIAVDKRPIHIGGGSSDIAKPSAEVAIPQHAAALA